MAENPAPSSPLVTSPDAAAPPLPAEFTKLTFRSLYIRRTGPGSREMTVDGRPSDQLGRRFVSDFPIYDGRGSGAHLVARLQGVTVQIGSSHQLVSIVFEAERLKGSTLLTNGVITDGSDEWAIYGGTGVFAMATGVIRRRFLAEVVREVSGTYGMFEGATTLTSIRILTSSRTWGPWGIEDGTRFCITAPIGSSIVGFYGRSTSRLVAAIGVYLRQQL
ncbi:hypothetical protein ZEAMMB73_Zm00001d035560 [Zea mays]|uniref:Dirigent protein n=1 Tax=Zea mays TaxID=4577 RepID=A0A1D6LHA2_MAIZE|nr:hypothetical protein ZEAMMB73_Zm00001d035560 [Zea mays]